jgi:hypothetical protein
MAAFGASCEAHGEAIFGGDLLGSQISSFAFGGGGGDEGRGGDLQLVCIFSYTYSVES